MLDKGMSHEEILNAWTSVIFEYDEKPPTETERKSVYGYFKGLLVAQQGIPRVGRTKIRHSAPSSPPQFQASNVGNALSPPARAEAEAPEKGTDWIGFGEGCGC